MIYLASIQLRGFNDESEFLSVFPEMEVFVEE